MAQHKSYSLSLLERVTLERLTSLMTFIQLYYIKLSSTYLVVEPEIFV